MESMEGAERLRAAMGARIVHLREVKGWSQPELAVRAGITQPSLWSIENGKTIEVTYRTLVSIADALETTADYLWSGVEREDERARQEAELIAIFRRLEDANARFAVLQSARTVLHAMPAQAAEDLLNSHQRKRGAPSAHERRKR